MIKNSPVWDNRLATRYPKLVAKHSASVCVVGLGGSGLAAITRLLELGCDVVGLDSGAVAGGAAGRNGGFLLAGLAAFHHAAARDLGRQRAVECYRKTLVEMNRMVDETPSLIRLDGSLRVATGPEELEDCRVQLEAMQSDGLPVDWYRGPEGEGLLIPTDGVFQPLERCRVLAQSAVASGAKLFEDSPAVKIENGLVTTPDGSIRCDSIIVAVDGGLECLLPELSGRVRTARLQMLATEPTAELRSPFAVYSRFGYEYWQQLPDGGIALGGMRDLGGDAEWTTVAVPSPEVQSLLETYLRKDLGVTARVTHRWAASVGYTPDGLPICEEVREGVWAMGGYSGTGNVVGAICGRAVAQQLASGEAGNLGVLF